MSVGTIQYPALRDAATITYNGAVYKGHVTAVHGGEVNLVVSLHDTPVDRVAIRRPDGTYVLANNQAAEVVFGR